MSKITGILLIFGTMLSSAEYAEGTYKKLGRPTRPAAQCITMDTSDEILYFRLDNKGRVTRVEQPNPIVNIPNILPAPNMINPPQLPMGNTVPPQIAASQIIHVPEKPKDWLPQPSQAVDQLNWKPLDECLAWMERSRWVDIDSLQKKYPVSHIEFPIFDREQRKNILCGSEKQRDYSIDKK